MQITQVNQFLKGKGPKPLINLKQRIGSSINQENFYGNFFDGFQFGQKVTCPFHDDGDPSFSIREDGVWKCFGCNITGNNPVEFIVRLKGVSFADALDFVYRIFIIDEFPVEHIKKNRKLLLETPEVKDFLITSRGISAEIQRYFKIGLKKIHGTNFVSLPLKDEYGYYRTSIFWNFLHTDGGPKFLYDSEYKFGQSIFPFQVLGNSKKIYIMEGYPDCLLALGMGLPAITFGSCNSWRDEWAEYLSDMDIVICYDSDKSGKKGRDHLLNVLAKSVRSLKALNFPEGQDFSDFLSTRKYDTSDFFELEKSVDFFKENFTKLTSDSIEEKDKDAILTTLTNSSNAEYYGKNLKIIGLVGGKEPAPLLLPKRMILTCKDSPTKAKCANCDLDGYHNRTQTYEIDESFPDLLKWAATPVRDQSKIYRMSLGTNPRCRVQIDYLEMRNIEKVVLHNPIKHGALNELPERRLTFYLGKGLNPNRHYSFNVCSRQHPMDNSAVLIATNAEPLDTELETFRVTPKIVERLKGFQPMGQTIEEKLNELYKILSKNVTRIWGREGLHAAIDLVFYSPNSFVFAGEELTKTSLDILVYGDQRCGKGKIAEGLIRYYEFGEVLSGENLSFMNLVGGIEASDTYRGLKWGRFVANNGGIVAIDETSAIERTTLAKLSRIRSEGIAELDKYGIHSKAFAKCGLIWVSNTRGNTLSSFNFGVEALRDLIGQNEDIARFDYVVAVRTDEVSGEKINRTVKTTEDPYGSNLHRGLILWCKSRTAEQIQFTDRGIETAYEEAQKLAKEYTSDIPLIQVENVRIKLAKIAAAVAGRVFSCDITGENLIVNKKHFEFAANFLRQMYNSYALGYKDYSNMIRERNTFSIKNMNNILEPLQTAEIMLDFIKGMLRIRIVSVNDIMDFTGMMFYEARSLLSELVKCGAIVKEKEKYLKSPGFTEFVKKKFHQLSLEEPEQKH